MLLLCTFNEETCVLAINLGDTLAGISEKFCCKWSCLSPTGLRLYYKLPNCHRCMLVSDEDVRNMSVAADSLNVNHLHVDVLPYSNSGSLNSSASVNLEELEELPNFGDDTGEHCARSVCSRNDKSSMNLWWDKIVLDDESVFQGGAPQFRLCLQKLSLQSGFHYVYLKNDRNRIKAVCAMKDHSGCGWMVYATKKNGNGFFYVRQLCNVHTCGSAKRSFGGGRMSSNLVCDVIRDNVRDKPSMTPSEVKHLFSQFGYPVSYDIARAGVEKARGVVFGDIKHSFNSLPAYVESVKESNPGACICLDVDPVSRRFQRLFVAFSGCIRGFSSCMPLLFLDGAHLKSQYKGHLLSATGNDGNQGIYPLCFAIVDSESYENWHWFLSHMREFLTPDRNLTFITDRNSGLIDSISTVFPSAFHAFCLYHLKLNLRAKCSRRDVGKFLRIRLVSLLSECAYASTPDIFHRKMDDMLRQGGEPIPESFNARVLKERYLPVAQMVDSIRVKIMKLHSDRRQVSLSWTFVVCPKIDASLSEAMNECRNWNVVSSTRFQYEVHSSPTAMVNLHDFSCSYFRWQAVGYPCPHEADAIIKTGYELYQFVDNYYLTQTYADSYAHSIYPFPYDDQRYVMPVAPSVLNPFSIRQPG